MGAPLPALLCFLEQLPALSELGALCQVQLWAWLSLLGWWKDWVNRRAHLWGSTNLWGLRRTWRVGRAQGPG